MKNSDVFVITEDDILKPTGTHNKGAGRVADDTGDDEPATSNPAGLTVAALQNLDPRLQLQLYGLGASRTQVIWQLWKESRLLLLAALMAGFGAAISEVGAVMMVGGNLLGHTRVLTTAIVLETGKGEFAPAIALGVILLLLAFMVNTTFTWIQQRSS